jgi:hypothetical protein
MLQLPMFFVDLLNLGRNIEWRWRLLPQRFLRNVSSGSSFFLRDVSEREFDYALERLNVGYVAHLLATGVEKKAKRTRVLMAALLKGEEDVMQQNDGRIGDE